MDIKGVFTIMPTPFTGSGELDVPSLERLVDFQIECGVYGLAILGFLGEAHKLASGERRTVIQTVLARVGGRIPVWVGIRALGTIGAIEQGREAEALGAQGLFAAPIGGLNDAALFDYYRSLAAAVKLPVYIHDYPEALGAEISAELVAHCVKDGGVAGIKLEEPPVGIKLSKIRELAGAQCKIFGGLGGTYFLEELERGANGTMTGFAFPEILVRIYEAYAAGKHDEAARVFDHYCPLIRYEFQPKVGIALRKHTYMRRGAIASDFIRPPGPKLDAITRGELERTVNRVGLDLDARGRQPLL
jgi:4-hydroxy-tetrahydrodipicolinate synthase